MIDQSANPQTIHWLSEALVLRLLSKANNEFREETYDINRIAREAIIELGQDTEGLGISSERASTQIINFCSLLGATPKYFLELLNEEVITSHSHIVTLNSRNELVAARFLKEFRSQYPSAVALPQYMGNEKVAKEMFGFVNVVAKKVSKVYEECSGLIRQSVEGLTLKIKHSKLMNNFILYKIFREISVTAKRTVEDRCTETVFRNCPIEVVELFFHYIINKFEVIRLFANQEIGAAMFEPSPAVILANFQRNEDIDLMAKEAVSCEGKCAIFVKTYSEKPDIQRTLEDYLLLLDDNANLRLLNCKTLRKRWFIIGDLKVRIKLSAMARDYIVDSQFSVDALRKDKQEAIEELLACEPLECYTNFNGIIGRCLYLMKRYSGVSEFFKDLSKRAILTRSMEEIMYQIPIVGYMIFAGTFSANFYKIFSNRFSTEKKKLQEFGGFMLNTTTTVGTSILGAITGQMLIPIPVVGALIGSVIGGLIGDKGGKQINSWIEKKKFLETVKYLQQSQVDQQHWLCTPQFYKALEIKEEEFQNYVPSYMQDYVFATLIAFVLACFYESKRLNSYNLEKSRRLAETGRQEEGYVRRQKQLYEEINRMNLEEDFETEFNIMRMVEFLEEHEGHLYEHYDTLERSILHNLTKIIH